MPSIEDGLYQLGRLDRLASQDTAVHRVDPRAKVLTTFVFLICVVSFGKYELLAMLPFLLFPVALVSEGNLPARYILSRLLVAAPFALVVGVFNPLLDREIFAHIGSLGIAGGWVSYASIILRFLLTTAAAIVLVGTTSMSGVCNALERLGVPDVLSTQLLLLYRYIFVLGEEVMRMARARALRSFGGRGMGPSVYAQMLGHLLLRTYARAQRIYLAMKSRGFDGHVRALRRLRFTGADVAFLLGWSAFFVLARVHNLPLLIGAAVTRLVS
ncbi:MAG: cobalt ECF transporter T component CbiQ [Coriobacteriia bacterium]|nr:cobalt ECF transporter T component CbiQ [Coriobacteriia bacterium]